MTSTAMPGDGDWPEEVIVARDDVEDARDEAALGKRTQKTWYLTQEVVERANAAVYWCLPIALAHSQMKGTEVDTARIPDSASALVEMALWAEVLRLEAMYNEGKPFNPAPEKLRPGPGRSGVSRLSLPRGTRSPRSPNDAAAADPGPDGPS